MEPVYVRYSFAIALGVFAFILKNIGYTLQKRGVAEVAAIPGKHRVADYLSTRIWLVGVSLPFVGALILVAAYLFGPLAIIMPFMGTGLVALVLFSKFFLGESIERVEWLSIAINCVGIVLLGVFGGAVDDGAMTQADAIRRVTDLEGMFFLCSPLVLCVFITVFAYGGTSIRSGIMLSACAGIVGGTSLVMQKLLTYGIRECAARPGLADVAGIAVPGGLLVVMAVIAVWLLTQAFKRGKAIVITPVYSAIQMLLPILGGIFVYGEWDRLPDIHKAMEAGGILLVAVSIVILSVYDEKRNRVQGSIPAARRRVSHS